MFLRPYGSKRLLASPSDCVFKNPLLCINKSKIALSFVDDAKVGTKKMRSNLLKRIQ